MLNLELQLYCSHCRQESKSPYSWAVGELQLLPEIASHVLLFQLRPVLGWKLVQELEEAECNNSGDVALVEAWGWRADLWSRMFLSLCFPYIGSRPTSTERHWRENVKTAPTGCTEPAYEGNVAARTAREQGASSVELHVKWTGIEWWKTGTSSEEILTSPLSPWHRSETQLPCWGLDSAQDHSSTPVFLLGLSEMLPGAAEKLLLFLLPGWGAESAGMKKQ